MVFPIFLLFSKEGVAAKSQEEEGRLTQLQRTQGGSTQQRTLGGSMQIHTANQQQNG
jgi:hypothetical protein